MPRPANNFGLGHGSDRKPHLLRPLAAQLLPQPLASIDPAERLWIDLSSLRTDEEFREVLASVLAAVARGETTPAEGAQIAKRVDVRLRASRRLARLTRRVSGRPATQTRAVHPRRIP